MALNQMKGHHMFKFAARATLFLLTTASIALAGPKKVHGLSESEISQLKLNQVEQLYPLVEKYDSVTNTNLKMKVSTYALGGSTDVSNLMQVYLACFSHSEMKQGGSLHLIATVDKVLSVTRVSAGVYRIVVQEWPVGDEWQSPVPDFRLRKVAYTVEASDLTVDLRQLPGVGEFDERQFTTAVHVSRQVLN